MKIGVALTGCSIGGVGAHHVLNEIEQQGLQIAMVSASCLPAATALGYAYGYPLDRLDKLATDFLHDEKHQDLDTAVGNLSDALPLRGERQRLPIAVSAADLRGGGAVAFTNDFTLESGNLRTIALDDAYDALSATLSGVGGLCAYPYCGCLLCDYSAQHGCPVAPLRLCGCPVLSVSFLPACPACAYDALQKRVIAASRAVADLHIDLEFQAGDSTLAGYIETARSALGVRLREEIGALVF